MNPGNLAPIINVGDDDTVFITEPTLLSATADDDSLPNPPGLLSYIWRDVNDNPQVTFSDLNSAKTMVTFSDTGTFTLECMVSDGELSNTDTVVITVIPLPINTPPVVSAGPNQTVTLPESATLNGSATDDGLPNPPGQLTYLWRQVGGPGAVTFAGSQAAMTLAAFSIPGDYTLALIASDSELSDTDEVTILVTQPVCIPMDGMISWWSGDENAEDVIGGHNGTFSGSTYEKGLVKRAFWLNGSNDFIEVEGSLFDDFPSAGTVETWFKLDKQFSIDSSEITLWDKVNGPSLSNRMIAFFAPSTGKLHFRMRDYETEHDDVFSNDSSWYPDIWYHAAFVWDASFGMRMYINGTVQENTNSSTQFIESGSLRDFAIGANRACDPPCYYFPGLIDEMTVYNRALTEGEIQSIYNAGSAGKCKPEPINEAPLVSAGPDIIHLTNNPVQLFGTASDDGLPYGTLATTWRNFSGPGTVEFNDTTIFLPIITTSASGIYHMELAAFDGELTTADSMRICATEPNISFFDDFDNGVIDGLRRWYHSGVNYPKPAAPERPEARDQKPVKSQFTNKHLFLIVCITFIFSKLQFNMKNIYA